MGANKSEILYGKILTIDKMKKERLDHGEHISFFFFFFFW